MRFLAAVCFFAATIDLASSAVIHVDGQGTSHGFKLQWSAQPEQAYVVEETQVLPAPASGWQAARMPLVAEGTTLAWSDEMGEDRCFYRIRLDPTWMHWTNRALPPETRTRLLLRQMTLEEKISMVHGVPGSYVGNTAGVPRLGIPGLHLQDGPAGVADGAMNVTALPAPILLASTWNEQLAREYGALAGTEARGKGVHVLLGPMINMVRVPQGGRNFETYGEDPYLASRVTAAVVRGIQSQQVIATAKHFVANDQETTRGNVNALVSERALREIYYPPFLASVRAGIGSICSAYNGINGSWCSETTLLIDHIKSEWGFKGFIVCDWGANFGMQPAAMNGLDLEMATGVRFGDPLKAAVLNGSVPATQLDQMAGRILSSMFRHGIMDHTPTGNISSVVYKPEHAQQARRFAEQGIVLLKNSHELLPLNQVGSIAVSGVAAHLNPIWTGTGSAQVFYMAYYDTPFDAIARRAGSGTTVSYHTGQATDISAAVQAARNAEVAIVCVGEQTGEGKDRTSFALPPEQDALVDAISQANSNTVVVLYAGSGTLMPWIGKVAAVISAWYPGLEGARALASILWGDVNPSGKLPISFPASATQVPASEAWQFPGTNLVVTYAEGIFIGYRWYDQMHEAPLFPFGHGLSYTRFSYSNLVVEAVNPAGEVPLQFYVQNKGNVRGTETAQVYVGFPGIAGSPPRELKSFARVDLQPGETKQIAVTLRWEDICHWNTGNHTWQVPTGTFQIFVGSSSRDLRLTNTFVVSSMIPMSRMKNLVLFQPVDSSVPIPGWMPEAAVDGDPATFLISPGTGGTKLIVDLGSIIEINRVRLAWGTNYAASYAIDVSEDNNSWSQCHVRTNGTGGFEELLVSGAGRYLRLRLPQTAFDLAEVEVFGP